MNNLTDTDLALLKAASEAPLRWVAQTNEKDLLRTALAKTAKHLDAVKNDPAINELQRDLLNTAMATDLSAIFLRGRATQALSNLHDLTITRMAEALMADTAPMHIPVRVHRRKWGERIIHIYRVEPVSSRHADDHLTVLPGDLFEVLEPDETADGRSTTKVVSRHMTLDAANLEADRPQSLPRFVRLVATETKPLTALAGNGSEIIVGSTTELVPVQWSDRLEEAVTGPLEIIG